MTPDQIVAQAQERGVQLVRFLYCDNGGVIRGKSTHVGQLARRMQSGIGLVKGMQSFTSIDTLAPDATYGPVGEIRLIPDPSTFVILPYAPRSAQMVVNMIELDHSPWALDPRSFLQRMVAQASSAGLAFDAAFENEFYLAFRTEDGYRPVDRSLCFSAIGMESTEEVIQDIIAALTEQGLTVELSHPELGWGQQELSIRHAPAVSAADNQITYRQTVRGVAARHGLVASLAPKPFADQAGSGAHLHWSIWDKDHKTNRLADAKGKDGLSPLARNAIGGVLNHLPGLLGHDDPERQLVPASPAALLELRLHRLGHREPRGRRPRPEPLLGRRDGLHEPRAQGERRQREPVHLARRGHRRRARRDRARSRPGGAGQRGPRQPDRRRARPSADPALSGDGPRGARRARAGRGPDDGAR